MPSHLTKLLLPTGIIAVALAGFALPAWSAEEYNLSGTFDGCEHGKMYEVEGGGILECLTYNYFYEYRPRVVAVGRTVVVIGNEKIDAVLHKGQIIKTTVAADFEGCDFDKVYKFDNGLLFQCTSFNFTYAFRPEVKIYAIQGRRPVVHIGDRKYDGVLMRTK